MSAELEISGQAMHVELVLNRPAVRNALSRTLMAELTAELKRAGDDSAVRAIIVTGAPPAFCAGLDLNEVAAAGAVYDNSPLLTLFETIESLPKPVIAAVNGPAMAGGAVLASVCDVAVCASAARIGYPGIKRGLVAPLAMSYLCRLVGERHARYLVLTGQVISASQALAMGLVDEVVGGGEVMARARQIASDLALLSAAAVRETKRVFGTLRQAGGDAAAVRRLNASVWSGGSPG
jgi:methylglutaconyl-CoA hydratase